VFNRLDVPTSLNTRVVCGLLMEASHVGVNETI